ncbi:MAG: hypothetical protein Q4G71_01235 [Pseudomonadota bacterium]|nr:hypothetical protein [Pseudomonadota bacterium]
MATSSGTSSHVRPSSVRPAARALMDGSRRLALHRRRVQGARTMGFERPANWPPEGDDAAPMDEPIAPPPRPTPGSGDVPAPEADDAPF